jgi:small subunit ribosomal protein S21
LAKVVLKKGESQEKLLKRFSRKVVRSGVLGEVRKRRWFVSRNEEHRLEKKKTVRRIQQRRRKRKERLEY